MTLYKIAGVTFENEDGTSRQDLLKNLYEQFKKEHFVVQANHITYDGGPFDGEQGIQILSKRQVIGMIPKADVDKIQTDVTEMVCCLDKADIEGKTVYFGTVRPRIDPSAKQYQIVIRMYRAHQLQKLPIYDKYLYSETISRKNKYYNKQKGQTS